MPENQSIKLRCHKHGETPSLIIGVEGQCRAHYCLVCFEDMLARQGVRAMYPAARLENRDLGDDWPEELLEVK